MAPSDNEEEKFISAAEDGDLWKMKELIEDGLISLERHDEIIDDGDGETALMWASRNGHLEVVRFLLESDSVDVNRTDNVGFTALHGTSYKGNLKIMKCLIDKGAKVNKQTIFRWTPLHGASHCGHLSAVKLLLEMGADPLIQNKYNKTALDEATHHKHIDVVNAIKQHIQRPQQIRDLLQCDDKLPIALWPKVFSPLNSLNFNFQLFCELPHLFRQVAEGQS